jgi:hypothetical protein
MRGWIVGAVLALGITACGGSVSTADVQNFVVTNVQKGVSSPTVPTATCVQASDTTWTCAVDYTVLSTTASVASEQTYEATLNVTCDSSGTCVYPAFTGTPVNP